MAMSENSAQTQLDVFIRAGLIAALAYFCFLVVKPFLSLMLWSVILAISLYPLQKHVMGWLGIRAGWAATLIVLVATIVVLAPSYLLAASTAASLDYLLELIKTKDLRVPTPDNSVASWPLVGGKLFDVWQRASTDLSSVMKEAIPHVRKEGLEVLAKIARIGTGFLMFIFALVIAGIFIAYGETGSHSAIRFTSRVVGGDRGPQIATLCTATIRAVAQGVIGIAVIQMLLVGVGFVAIDLPGAGLLSVVVLLVSILQLPSFVITLPIIGAVFFREGFTTVNIAFAIYTIIASQADNLLKPLVLGRGVGVPMPVVLIGVLGGTIMTGIIGLFIGPVILAVGYQLFWQWVDQQPDASSPPPSLEHGG